MSNNTSYSIEEMSREEISQAFSRCFISREGKIVLSFLRHLTVERSLGPDASAEELRHLEGQRCLVRQIENLCSQK